MAKSATLSTRIEPELKEQAERILTTLGVPESNAITMFCRQIVMQKGLLFDVKLPISHVVDASTLTHEQLNAELEKGTRTSLLGTRKM